MAAQRSKATKGKQASAEVLRKLPAVDRVLEHPEVAAWAAQSGLGQGFLTRAINAYLEKIRRGVLAGELDTEGVDERLESIAAGVAATAAELASPHLRHVINATGVVVHTNLGRSPWPTAAADRVAALTRRYLNLEFDLATGGRGQRGEALERLVGQLFPSAAVAVVNNNAAAVLLVLNTLAEGKEVVVSRGQLVEIGGSFRIPDVMTKSQSLLREVGTTNRTRIGDFEAAIGPNTGVLLSVHPSNYRVVGFTEEAGLGELVALGRQHSLPVVEDLGSGCLIDLRTIGIDDEPSVADRLATGVDLVTFSGDKLLGGPQAGFIVGNPELVARLRSNALYRALHPLTSKNAKLSMTTRKGLLLGGHFHEASSSISLFIREGAPIVDVDARPAQACPAGQRGDVWIRPRYDGHRTARSPFGEIERKALDSGTCRSANRAPNVRVGSRTDLRRHHLEGLFPGVKRTQPARKRTSALEDCQRGAGWLNVALWLRVLKKSEPTDFVQLSFL